MVHHTQELGALERKARLTTKCAQYLVRVVMSSVHQTWARGWTRCNLTYRTATVAKHTHWVL